MKAELISVGTELLLGHTIDTDAAYASRELAAAGVDFQDLIHGFVQVELALVDRGLDFVRVRSDQFQIQHDSVPLFS